jgi:tetratricopeptide (TPR) repeat protein
MRCITCHDPHVEPTHAQAPAYFNAKCMQCHTQSSCTEPVALRRATAPADNCIGCHMPKRDDLALSHSALTNHRIVTREDEPFPAATFHQTTAALPDLIYLDREATGQQKPSSETLLQAYDQLRHDHPEYQASYDRLLTQLAATEPDNAEVVARLGDRELQQGDRVEAQTHLKHAASLDPNLPQVFSDLSTLSEQQGDAASAIAFAQRAATLDPFNANRRRDLVVRLIDAHQYAAAVTAMKQFLAEFPEDAFLRKALAIAEQP